MRSQNYSGVGSVMITFSDRAVGEFQAFLCWRCKYWMFALSHLWICMYLKQETSRNSKNNNFEESHVVTTNNLQKTESAECLIT